MKKLGSILTILVIVTSVTTILAAFAIGDCRLFIFMNQTISHPLLDILCAYGSPVVFVAFYLFSMAKLVVGRPRPYIVVPSARVIGPWSASSFSFPSTTTMLVFGLTIPLLLISQKRSYGIVLLVLSYFVGFSVIYTGFHFPADVAAGALLSLGLGVGMSEFVRRKKVRVVKDVQTV